MLKDNWIKLSVFGYVCCILTYNFFGTASPAWTNFFYTYEKGFAALCIAYSFKETKTLIDKLFINFHLMSLVGTWLFFVLASFNDKFWVHHQTILVSTLIMSSFGSLIVLWHLIRRTLK